jgi:hypothetical protein
MQMSENRSDNSKLIESLELAARHNSCSELLLEAAKQLRALSLAPAAPEPRPLDPTVLGYTFRRLAGYESGLPSDILSAVFTTVDGNSHEVLAVTKAHLRGVAYIVHFSPHAFIPYDANGKPSKPEHAAFTICGVDIRFRADTRLSAKARV